MPKMDRRSFLGASGAALALGAAGTAGALGSNERIRVGVAGVRGRGGNHIDGFNRLEGVDVAALADPDQRELAKRSGGLKDAKGKSYQDVRAMLDDRDIDVVSIATPNHWHSLIGIWACQAGKDVYIEKPCSHNVFEGRRLVEAARKHRRIVQHGTQIRSSSAVREAMAKLEEGVIGEVYMARGLCYKWRNTIGRTPEEDAPKDVDYNLWLGPAPERRYTRNRFHYNWHWHWDYGNGDIGNQGVHQMDIARWGLGVGLPRKVQSLGGHFMFDDDQETPNTLMSSFFFPEENKLLVFEVRHWITNDESDVGIGVLFYGSEGYMAIPSYDSYKTYLGRKKEPGPAARGGGDHYANFIEAVRAREPEILHAPIEEGHLSSALCHLANVSYRLGRSVEFDPEDETCPGDAEASAMLSREYRAPFVVPAEV